MENAKIKETAPLAQLDRVPVFGTGGSGSNPARGRFFIGLGRKNLARKRPNGFARVGI